MNQEAHHANKNKFKTEYLKMLQDNEIDYKQEYVFEFWDQPDELG